MTNTCIVNPLHRDLYAELNKMESEIVKMIGNLFDMPESGGGGNINNGRHRKHYFGNQSI